MSAAKDESSREAATSNDGLERLLPCPFCGESEIEICEGSTFRWAFAACSTCGAQAGEVRINTLIDRGVAWEKARKDAVEEWNKRAPNVELRREP